MDASAVAGCFRDKTMLITGSTGFLGKLMVEKILRVQPDVKKLYLLVRAPDAATAEQCILSEVLEKDLFNTLREKHGLIGFQSLVKEKIVPLVGDIGFRDFGLDGQTGDTLSEEINVIINGAATTSFYERYDVALASNVLGAKYGYEFAKKCRNLKLLLHFFTGLPILDGQTCMHFTKAMGEMLIEQHKEDLPVVIIRPTMVTSTYQDPFPGWIEGARTIDAMIVAYDKESFPCFIGDRNDIMDVVPADMVVNATLVAMAIHWNAKACAIYHVGSSLRNPLPG